MGLELFSLLGIFLVGPSAQVLVLSSSLMLCVLTWAKGFSSSYLALDSMVSQGLTFLCLVLTLSVFIDLDGDLFGLKWSTLSLSSLLILSFSSKQFLTFYVFYESSLVPMVLIVLAWGFQPERLVSGVYILFYTLSASMPLLWVILSSSNIDPVAGLFIADIFLVLCWSLSFLVNLPVYGLHLWLPLAHVEAPNVGSIMLAGLLLKLSCFGFYLVWSQLALELWWLLASFFLYGGALASLIAFNQNDIKSLIAYSSIVHIAWILLVCLWPSNWSFLALTLVSMGHGLSSSGLFCSCSSYYESYNTRSLLVLQGGILALPGFIFTISVLVVASCNAPPTISWLGEVILSSLAFPVNLGTCTLIFCFVFFSMGYTLLLFSNISSGSKLESLSVLQSSLKDLSSSSLHTYWQVVTLGLIVLVLF